MGKGAQIRTMPLRYFLFGVKTRQWSASYFSASSFGDGYECYDYELQPHFQP